MGYSFDISLIIILTKEIYNNNAMQVDYHACSCLTFISLTDSTRFKVLVLEVQDIRHMLIACLVHVLEFLLLYKNGFRLYLTKS